MNAIKREQQIIAFQFLATAKSNNLKELESDIKKAGGISELVDDNLVIITIGGQTYNVPLGFVLVIERGNVGRVLSKAAFDNEFLIVVEEDAFDLDGLVARVDTLEQKLASIEQKTTNDKPTNSKDKS